MLNCACWTLEVISLLPLTSNKKKQNLLQKYHFNSFIDVFIIDSFIKKTNSVSSYLDSFNNELILPLYSIIRFYVFSYDVIHSFGIYSFGIKIDAIPGRFNVSSTIRTLIKGEHRGFCYELCGYGHSSMLIVGLVVASQVYELGNCKNESCSTFDWYLSMLSLG